MSAEAIDPFSTRTLLKDSALISNIQSSWSVSFDDQGLDTQHFHLVEHEKPRLDALNTTSFQLSLEDVSLEQISDSIAVRPASRNDDIEQHPDAESDADVWDFETWEVDKSPILGNLTSWDTFANSEKNYGLPPSFSEAGPTVFDAALHTSRKSTSNGQSRRARTDLYRDALANLVLGRASAFFRWDDKADRFRAIYDNVTISGHSPELTQEVSNLFCDHGAKFKQLQRPASASPCSSATLQTIRSAAHSVTLAVQEHFDGMQPQKLTILQLCSLRNTYAGILNLFNSWAEPSSVLLSEIDLITTFTRDLENYWQEIPYLRKVIEHLAARVLNPVIDRVMLALESSGDEVEDEWLLAQLLPISNKIFVQLMNCRHLLTRNGFSTDWIFEVAKPRLIFDSVQLEQYTRALIMYEGQIALSEEHSTRNPAWTSASDDASMVDVNFDSPFNLSLELPGPRTDTYLVNMGAEDGLFSCVLDTLVCRETVSNCNLSPTNALNLSIQSYFSMQLRLHSYVVFRSLFVQNDLVGELRSLRAFELLGNPLFASRLTTALFRSDVGDASKARNTGLSAGLNLEDREAWPPASSELRLVLLDVLRESAGINQQRINEGRISFAIRDLSADELEMCRDVHSIHALDFLRISYTPTNDILNSVIGAQCLEKYDRIFRYLLVLLRCKMLTQRFVFTSKRNDKRSTLASLETKLFMEMNHFMTAMLDYALAVAIQEPWLGFEEKLTEMEEYLHRDDYAQTLERVGSISQLETMHETILDEILIGLMLKRRQASMYGIVIKILNLILRVDVHNFTAFSQVYHDFKQLIRSLIQSIATLTVESQDPGPGTARIICLATRLDLFGYYE